MTLPPPVQPPTRRERVRWPEFIGREHDRDLRHTIAVFEDRGVLHRTVVTLLRRSRPRGQGRSSEACGFWSWRYRAVLLYAVLTRRRTISRFARAVGLPDESKFYTFLREWGIDYRCMTPAPRVVAKGEGRTVEGRLYPVDDGYILRAEGRVLPVRYTQYREWRIINDPGPDVTLEQAMRAAVLAKAPPAWSRGDPEAFVARLDRESRALTGHGIVPHPRLEGQQLVLERVVERFFGGAALVAAAREENACGCVFWDDQKLTCGIGPLRKPSRCEDFSPLEG